MKKLMKNIKLMVAVSTMLAMFAIAPIVHGGISWTGIDPIFTVDDKKVNIRVEFPSEFDCSLDGPIDVKVYVPKGSDTNFITESTGSFSGCTQTTLTSISEKGRLKDGIEVKVRVNSSEEFDVKVKVDLEGTWVREREGDSNKWLSTKKIKFNAADNGGLGSDPASNGRLNYTYEDDEDDDDEDDD